MEQMILRLCPTSYLSVARNVSIYDPVTIPTLYYTISYIHNVVRDENGAIPYRITLHFFVSLLLTKLNDIQLVKLSPLFITMLAGFLHQERRNCDV